jgi:plasmid maintenance system antidote protein VapI
MQEELDALQRRILSSERGPITAGTQIRIDKMFDTTRQMLQKYLQDKLLRDLELAVRTLG